MNTSLSYGPPMNIDIDYYIIRLFFVWLLMRISCELCLNEEI